MASGDRIIYRGKPGGILSNSGNTESGRSIRESVYEAIVVDIIVDHTHPEYSPKDGYNVGSAKVRIFSRDHSLDEEQLPWAKPIDSQIQQMPLLGELVFLQKILGAFFYSRNVPVAHRVQENGMLKLNEALNNRRTNTLSAKISDGQELQKEKHKFGEYYKPDSRVRPLKHFEGDLIMQGRMGHSIRLGSSQMEPGSKKLAPNIILRTGQALDAEKEYVTKNSVFGLTLENINKDASSIWMTSDQIVNFLPNVVEAGSFNRSATKPPLIFNGAQIIANSDRVVINSKKEHILMYSSDEIYLNSFKNTAIDTDNNIILTANLDITQKASRNIDNVADEDFTIRAGSDIFGLALDKVSFMGNKIYIGSVQNEFEPMVGGTSLSVWLARLITVLMGTPPLVTTTPQLPGIPYALVPPVAIPGTATAAHVITPIGPGVLNPQIVLGLTKLYAELVIPNLGSRIPLPFSGAPFNSLDNYVEISNDTPEMELNAFTGGSVKINKGSTWGLSDSHFKVV